MNVLMLLFKDIHLDARVQREARALADAGYDVDIACLYERIDPPPYIHSKVRLIRISLTTKRIKRTFHQTNNQESHKLLLKIVRSPLIKLLKDTFALSEFTRKTSEIFREKKYNVVHCHDLNTLPTGVYLKKKFKINLVYDSHELFNEMAGKNKIEKWLGYKLEKILIKKIDHLIVVNEYCLNFMKNRYGHNITSTILENTQDVFDKFPQKSKKNNYWRDRYKLKEEDVILIYQGGLTKQRGIEECIESLHYLSDKFKLIILGEGPLLPNLESMVKELELEERVFFHEAVPPSNILKLTAQADIGLVMYKNTCLNNYLSTPNKIFEYFISGIPAVSSNHPGKKYIIEKLGIGVCVDEDARSISKGILSVMEHYDTLRNNCLVHRCYHNWDREKKKLIKMYMGLNNEQEVANNNTTLST